MDREAAAAQTVCRYILVVYSYVVYNIRGDLHQIVYTKRMVKRDGEKGRRMVAGWIGRQQLHKLFARIYP
jgi:hypothetical protein